MLRTEYLLQIAVFCFGGDAARREAMRLARADRFFDRAQLLELLPRLLEQYRW